MILSFQTDRSGQTVQTQIRLLLLWSGLILVWFLFYSPSTHFRSFQAWSVNLATLFLGKPPRQLPVLSAHSFASNWQLLFLNKRKRENGRRNVLMTKSPRKNVPDVGIELWFTCMPSELASDRATGPGQSDQGLHCLQFPLHLLDALLYGKSTLFDF